MRQYADSATVTVIGSAQSMHYPFRENAFPDVLNVAAVRGYCLVHVSVMSKLSPDHFPVSVHVAKYNIERHLEANSAHVLFGTPAIP